MKEIITYRLSGVGVWHYEFCLNGEPFGSVVSRVSRSEPARIEGPGISWYSRFDMDRDIVPGVSRKVKDSRTGEEVYRIIWWQPDLYEVRARDKFVLAEIRDGNYLFGEPGAPVAAMTERTTGATRLVKGEEAEMRFRTMFFDPVNDAFRMMVLSFPALRFC